MIFQTMNFIRSNNQSLKYQRCTPSGCKDIVIRKIEFLAKTQFLYALLMARLTDLVAPSV